MIGIILAAGKGDTGLPGRFLQVDEKSVISWHLDILDSVGIPAVVVIGYAADHTLLRVGSRAACVYNPRYAETGSLYSLWLARKVLWKIRAKDAIIIHADMFTEPFIALAVLRHSDNAVVTPGYDGQGARLYLDADNRVVAQGIATDPDPQGVSFAGYARLPWDCLGELNEMEGYETLSVAPALIGCRAIIVEGTHA